MARAKRTMRSAGAAPHRWVGWRDEQPETYPLTVIIFKRRENRDGVSGDVNDDITRHAADDDDQDDDDARPEAAGWSLTS